METHIDLLSLPQALLLSGPKGSGKTEFAQNLCQKLLCKPSDTHTYLPEGKTQQHPMASIRQMIAEVSLPPFESPVKIFIFHDAEKMLPPSANALLKTLEEPPLDTYILLLTTNLGAIIPTIISRCRLIPFTPKPTSTFQLPKPLHEILSAPETIDALLEEYSDEDRLRFTDALFEAILDDTRTKNPLALESTLSQITTLRTAVLHHVKLRTAVELFLLR